MRPLAPAPPTLLGWDPFGGVSHRSALSTKGRLGGVPVFNLVWDGNAERGLPVARSFRILAIAGPIFLAACATAGVKVTNEQAQSFKIGKSTYADVVAAL